MNKTMSKAKELLINSRMMRKNENKENKNEIPMNSNEVGNKDDEELSKIQSLILHIM